MVSIADSRLFFLYYLDVARYIGVMRRSWYSLHRRLEWEPEVETWICFTVIKTMRPPDLG